MTSSYPCVEVSFSDPFSFVFMEFLMGVFLSNLFILWVTFILKVGCYLLKHMFRALNNRMLCLFHLHDTSFSLGKIID